VPETTILFLTADPSDSARLRLGQEIRDVRERLDRSQVRERFALVERHCVRVGDLTQAIFDTNPRVVHFSGHGAGQPGLCFEDDQGHTRLVSTDALENLFALLAESVSCVVLNACLSLPQARAIARHVRYVIGMRDSISDEGAIAFSTGFYKALLSSRPIEASFGFGVVELQLLGIEEAQTPVFVRNLAYEPRHELLEHDGFVTIRGDRTYI